MGKSIPQLKKLLTNFYKLPLHVGPSAGQRGQTYRNNGFAPLPGQPQPVTLTEEKVGSATPLPNDLLSKRRVVTVPDAGAVLLGAPRIATEVAMTPRKIASGEILVEVYGGREIWKSQEKQNEVGKLRLSLKAVKGVMVDIHEDGEGDTVTKAVVHMPARAVEKDAESTKQEALIRTIQIAINESLRRHRVPDVRWLDGIGKQQYFRPDSVPGLDKP